ncbi:MAG: hypothetical protein JNG88_04370 [Phycisphaerales bacterium]|nr:hypothetical protein [Phycisphaerales bacterium]
MPDQKHSDFVAGLPHRFRAWRDNFRADYQQWRVDVRSDWTLVYRNPIGAIAFTVIGVVIGVIVIRALISLMPPAPVPGGVVEPQYAILHIVCINPACKAVYDSKRPLDFADWPAKCDTCQQKTAYRATLCSACKKWYAVTPNAAGGCPHCAARAIPRKADEPKSTTPVDPDDLDDR